MVFSQELLINGKDHVEEYVFPELEKVYGEGTLRLRPLTATEWNEIDSIISNIGEINTRSRHKGKTNNDTAKVKNTDEETAIKIKPDVILRNEFRAKCKAIAYSLSIKGENKWSAESVGKLRPPQVINKIFDKVIELSGIDETSLEMLQSFHGDR